MKYTLYALLLVLPVSAGAQAILNKWTMNTTGKKATYYLNNGGMPPTYTFTVSTDSANVLQVAYSADSVWVRSNGLADTMGKYLNPGGCTAQAYVNRFPRVPYVPTTKTISPKGGPIGMLINGVPIYGLSNSASYTGSANANNGLGVWNVEVGKAEGFVLDAPYGAHPQQQGAYHSHDKPYKLYSSTPTTQHSPLIGFAFDGYPVYGPYGYSTAMNSSSAITRMKTGYSLRNITTRSTLPGGAAASQTGPAVNTTYPLGTYCEDYEWLAANGGDLDQYNGRFCVTPEYPAGTYAYFVTIDAAGAAAFPYYIGIYYYGQPVTANILSAPGSTTSGLTMPTSGVSFVNGTVLAVGLIDFTGAPAGSANKLEWQLAGDNAALLQEVERSEDGNDFTPLTGVPIYSADAKSYSYLDESPAAKSFYRLKLTEVGGRVTYSSVVAVQRKTVAAVRVYPTVINDMLCVANNTGAPARVTIRNSAGVTVQSATAGIGITSVTVAALPQGYYFVAVAGNAGVAVTKCIKQ